MRARDIPNLISALRIALIVPVVWLLLDGRYLSAAVLFALAGASDALDGWLARRNGWFSRLGSILDPLADKLMMVAVYLSLGWLHQLPGWLVALVLGRDLLIVAGGLVYHYRIGQFEMAPSALSKFNTAAQILLVVVVMAALAGLPVGVWLIDVMILLVGLSTIGSGLGYVWTWGRRALQGG